MTGAETEAANASTSRPRGFLRPNEERMRRACIALDDGRLDDAETNIDAITDQDPASRAWTLWLTGRLLACRQRAAEAIEHFERCAATCADDAQLVRLRAAAWEHIGLLRRRREELSQARSAHEQAYRLRSEGGGSAEECWESARSLTLTCSIAAQWDDAEQWCRVALDWAPQVVDLADDYEARSLAALADVESKRGRADCAVDYARQALSCHTRHDPGSLAATRAEATLARLLVNRAEALLAADPAQAAEVLDEGLERAGVAEESLLAFGAADDVRTCRELIDFAQRLRQELP